MRKFLILAGLIIIAVTAHASDCNTISFGRMIIQSISGLTMLGIGVR